MVLAMDSLALVLEISITASRIFVGKAYQSSYKRKTASLCSGTNCRLDALNNPMSLYELEQIIT
jgi:hypothetical protein